MNNNEILSSATSSNGRKIRFHYIDRAKAIAMLCVVFGHVNLFDYYGFGGNIDICKVSGITSIFQLPLFIFLSGLVIITKKRSSKEIFVQIYQKFRTLLMPLILLGGLYAYMCLNRMPWMIFESGLFLGYWYLWCLFVLYLLHYIYELLCPQWQSKLVGISFDLLWMMGWAVTLRFLVNKMPEENFLSLGFTANLFPYFFLGVMVKKYGLAEKLFTSRWTYTTGLLLAVVFIATRNNGFAYPLAFQTFCIGMIMLIVGLLRQFENATNHTLSFLDWVGKNTMDVYVFHYFFVSSFHSMWVGKWLLEGHYSPFMELLITGTPTLLFTILSIYIGQLLRLSPGLSKLIFFK